MKKVELNILGKNLSLSVNDGEEAHLESLAGFINQKAFKGAEDFETKAIMTLLALSDDSYKVYQKLSTQKDIIIKQKEISDSDKKEIENLYEDRSKTARFLSIVLSKLKTANDLLEKK